METILSIHGLSKRYGRIQAVNNLSIEIKKGQVFGILGPNGSGKTTTLSTVLSLVSADTGSFEWFGNPPCKENLKRIGSVIESPNFFPYLTAFQNLQIVAQIRGIQENKIDEVLQATALYDRRNSYFRTFSFGMKQRLAVASALLGDPDVMILDEPTNGLDPQGIAGIREIILAVAAKGITIILASHLLDEVQKICSHVAVLNKGNLLFSGKVSDVLVVSDSFELASHNIPELVKILSLHPKFDRVEENTETVVAHFKEHVNPGELNSFFFEKGMTLSHLCERKRTLEQHFLELLAENQHDQTA
ncbi:MAG: ATP-binding cassette domain-containing protein [Bacteroidota bacterium]|nr:ATP-binding cassette domain-containing protein [Bacteroidota bacterium]